MAVPAGNVPLKEQFNQAAALTVAVPIVAISQKMLNASLAAAINAAATTAQFTLPASSRGDGGISVPPFPAWAAVAGSVLTLGTQANGNREQLAITGGSIAGGVLTVTFAACANAHAIGDVAQINDVTGNAGTATYTFAAQAFNGNDRGIILELMDLLDRALRETSATVA